MNGRSRCTNHCPTCHAHFSSVAAFDAHRKGPVGDRHCAEPADLLTKGGAAVFGVKDMAGVCSIAGAARIGVVWTLARSLENRDGRIDGLRGAA